MISGTEIKNDFLINRKASLGDSKSSFMCHYRKLISEANEISLKNLLLIMDLVITLFPKCCLNLLQTNSICTEKEITNFK